VQARRALRPDGLLLASMLGGETLFELRQARVEMGVGVGGGYGHRKKLETERARR
jgi:NADH dehydrogenase [ubiquinone] 1 alpha subcomplex assembly factor 5